jgi:hypothetical protein
VGSVGGGCWSPGWALALAGHHAMGKAATGGELQQEAGIRAAGRQRGQGHRGREPGGAGCGGEAVADSSSQM